MVAQSPSTLQDLFLKHLRDNRGEVTIFLANGIRLQGQIRSCDNFTPSLSGALGPRSSTSMRSQQSVQRSRSNCMNPVRRVNAIDSKSYREGTATTERRKIAAIKPKALNLLR